MQITVALDGSLVRNLSLSPGDEVTIDLTVYEHDGDADPIAYTDPQMAVGSDDLYPIGTEFTIPLDLGRTPYRLAVEIGGAVTTVAYGYIETTVPGSCSVVCGGCFPGGTIPGSGSGGVVFGPASATDGHVALFDGTTGRLIKDSGLTFDAAVRAVTLTGLSLASTAAITATSTALEAFGQLQAQVTANLASGVQTTGVQTITANSASPVLTLTQSGAGLALNTTGGITSSAVVTGTRLVSTIATGTAPLTVASTTLVSNLNAQYLSGATFAAPGTIGGGTPGAITGTTITANTGFVGPLTGNVTGNVSGSSGSTTGNAATATALATARAINGVNFDGTAAITVTAAAGTLTGATLASGITASSLTSVGNLISLRIGSTPTSNPTGLLFVQSDTDGVANFGSQLNVGSAGDVNIVLRKSRGANTAQTIVQNADGLGRVAFFGYDGAGYIRAAEINAAVDGTPGVNDMPGRLTFSTTPDGAAAVTERMRIDNAGVVTIGAAPGSESLRVTPIASSANYATISGAVTTAGPVYGVAGSDTNIDWRAQTKGTGGLYFQTNGGTTQFRVVHVASAVDYLFVQGGTAGDAGLYAGGASTNANVFVNPKGTGRFSVYINGGASEQFRVTHTASTANYATVTGAVTTGQPIWGVDGSDTNISAIHRTKGTGKHFFQTGATPSIQLAINDTANSVNYWQFTGGATGNAASMRALGTDTNVSLSYSTQGTGVHLFYTNVASPAVQFAINHVASTVNYFGVSGSATGGFSNILESFGTDTNIQNLYASKGTYGHVFKTNGSGGQTQFFVAHTASAVNNFSVSGGATGVQPGLIATGSDTNVGSAFSTKGTGGHFFSTNSFGATQCVITHTASAVNYLQMTGSATGNAVSISTGGSDTNRGITITAAGTGVITMASAIAITNTVAAAVAIASTHKVTMVIGGSTYYLLASNV